MPEGDDARLLDELERLRADAEALRARLRASHDPRSRYAGEDRNGLARVIVDCHGRATDVVLAREWRRETDPAGLADALVHAADQAQGRRLEAWAAGGAPPATTPGLIAADNDEFDGRDLASLLALAEERLDEATARLESHFTDTVVVRDSGSELALTLQGGRLLAIDFDGGWIAAATADDIAKRVCRTLQNAHDRAGHDIGALLPRELRDVLAFSADPERLLRRLGLPT